MATCIGIDVGHGDVKVSYMSGGELANETFPSVVAMAEQDMSLTNPHMIERGLVGFNDKYYYVGDMATCAAENALLRKREDMSVDDPAWNALIRCALGLALRHVSDPGEIYVTSGLPVQFYNNPTSKSILTKTIESIGGFSIGRSDTFNPSCIGFCLPQSYATYLNECFLFDGTLNQSAPFSPLSSIGIIDIGEKTTDMVCIQGMNYIKHKASSTNLGMRDAVKIICDEVMQKHGVVVPPNRRGAMIREIDGEATLVANGGKMPIPDISSKALESVATRVLDCVESDWHLSEIEHLITTGGGSIRLFEKMQESSPIFKNTATKAKDGVYSNSNGYLKFAIMKSIVESQSPELKEAA